MLSSKYAFFCLNFCVIILKPESNGNEWKTSGNKWKCVKNGWELGGMQRRL